jgi:uncharacterized protein (TIGR02001 family)
MKASLAAALMSAATAAAAEDAGFIPGTFSGSATLATDYRFRGLSQTSLGPAIQGSIGYALDTGVHDTSIYVGAWASNVNFQDGNEANVELDLYGGLRGKVADVGWQVGAIGFVYPGADTRLNYNFAEVAGSLSYEVTPSVTTGLFYAFAPDNLASTGPANYVEGNVAVAVPLPSMLTSRGLGAGLYGLVGRQWLADNARAGIPDYLTWTIGAKLTYKAVSIGVAYIDTDIGKGDCFPNPAVGLTGRNWCGHTVVGTVSASF